MASSIETSRCAGGRYRQANPKIQPIIEAKYDEIYEICQKGIPCYNPNTGAQRAPVFFHLIVHLIFH